MRVCHPGMKLCMCKLIDDYELLHLYRDGMDWPELYKMYISFGEDPFIVPMRVGAEQCCEEICNSLNTK